VDITVSQNHRAEQKSQAAFAALQDHILNTYGLRTPSTPVLRLRNATQTSLVLEWDPIQMATSTLRSLALYRNGSKAGNIPRPLDMTSTKISGLAVDTEYSFYLVLKTSGGTYTSNVLRVKTHAMTNLTGITITPGVLPPQLRDSLEAVVSRIGARIADTVRIDTTHFVCTEGRGRDWDRANEMNIPVVRPEWIEGCEREGKIISVRGYYLDANPKHRQVGSNPSLSGHQRGPSTQPGPATGQRKDLPSRPTPKSPGRDSDVSGEPGPEVPPTPPPKKDLPPPPPAQVEEEGEEEGEKEDSEEEKEEEEEPETEMPVSSEKPALEQSDQGHQAEKLQKQPPEADRKERVEDKERSGDMEDVAL